MLSNQKKKENLQALKLALKFESNDFYTGTADSVNTQSLIETLHSVIDTFIELVEEGKGDDKKFQQLIVTGLERFDTFGLDTEDREKVCSYFEEIMDAVNLDSSGGAINEWLYGFKY